jgi:hypothetical protein
MTRGIRTASVFGVAGVLMASAGISGAEMMQAHVEHHHAAVHGPLTDAQYAAAVRVAQHQIDQQKPSRLTSATAVLKPGKVRQPNLADACHSGEVVKIRLVGRFPHVVTGGRPGGGSGAVTLVGVTTDAKSGRACLLGVGTGRSAPFQNAADLTPALSR